MGKGKKSGAAQRLSEAFEIPAESFTRVPRLTVTGDGRVQIEGHRGLVELTEESVAVRYGGTVVRINGAGLRLCGMNDTCVAFSGRVAGIDFGG